MKGTELMGDLILFGAAFWLSRKASNTMFEDRQQELHQSSGNDLAPDLDQLEFHKFSDGA